jgi:tRNA pseudouridine13 synthase
MPLPPPPLLDASPHVQPASYITADIPGIGGSIKQRPEDFLVDEQPLYQPEGEGEHIYLFVQKRNMPTLAMIDVIARHFGVRKKDVGFAGLKDKVAITRQVVSVYAPGKKPEDFPQLEHESVQILWVDRHTNKLRPGHLRGNRFSIRVRDVRPTDVLTVLKAMRILQRTGVPNRLGEQRFGMMLNNHLIGRAIVLKDYELACRIMLGKQPKPWDHWNTHARELFEEGRYADAITHFPVAARTETRVLRTLADSVKANPISGAAPNWQRAILSLDETVLRFYLSSFQSAVFNAVLDARLRQGSFDRLLAGDLAIKQNLAVFPVGEPELASPDTPQRLASFDISPSGPMWGTHMPRCEGEPGALDLQALTNFGMLPEHLEAFEASGPLSLDGKRRPLRVPIIDPEVEGGLDEHGPFVRLAFELPRGSFATVVLREIMKPAAPTQAFDEP